MTIDLEGIRAREAKATKGPWRTNDDVPWLVERPGNGGEPVTVLDAECAVDAEFIAHARTDVPALLALVDQMREALVAVEWNAPQASWESPHCRACQALKWNGGSHNTSCPIDAALVAIGLDTQAKRDAARAGMRGGR